MKKESSWSNLYNAISASSSIVIESLIFSVENVSYGYEVQLIFSIQSGKKRTFAFDQEGKKLKLIHKAPTARKSKSEMISNSIHSAQFL